MGSFGKYARPVWVDLARDFEARVSARGVEDRGEAAEHRFEFFLGFVEAEAQGSTNAIDARERRLVGCGRGIRMIEGQWIVQRRASVPRRSARRLPPGGLSNEGAGELIGGRIAVREWHPNRAGLAGNLGSSGGLILEPGRQGDQARRSALGMGRCAGGGVPRGRDGGGGRACSRSG